MTAEDDRALVSTEVKRPEGEVGSHAHHPLVHFRLFEQLKQRNVIRVAALYLVVCWLILEPVHVVFHMLDVPVWANRLVLMLMAVGFPAVVIFAWVYEVTPEGLKPTAEVPHGQSIRRLTGRRLDRAIIAVLAVALAYFVVDKFWISKHFPAAAPRPTATQEGALRATETPAAAPPVRPVEVTIPEKSVAVLPFVDMSEKHDQEYLADGLAEQLIDLFAKIPDLRVPARTSSFHFRGMSEDMPTIARQLRVAHVLEGSVRRAGNRLRVTAQLIRTVDGYHVWSDTYDREVHDIFKIQDDIASTIVNTLKATLIPLAGTRTSNIDAYMTFLIGRQHFDRDTLDGYRLAAKFFRHSIELDPNLGAAYSELSLADMMAGFYSREPPDAATVTKAADRGAALAPQNGRSFAARGLIRFWLRTDWRGAAADFTTALELAPGDAAVHRRYAVLLDDLGRHEEALTESERATDLDPLLPLSWEINGEELITAGHWQDARRALDRALELNPASGRARQDLAIVDLLGGYPDRALVAFRQGTPVEDWQWGIAVAEHLLGHEQASRAALDDYVHRFGNSRPFGVAEVYAFCGQSDEALRWLEQAYARRPADLVEMKGSWAFLSLRSDPRFKAFLRKMNLPE